MEAETSGQYEVEPQNELLGTEVYQSGSEDIDTVESDVRFYDWQKHKDFSKSTLKLLAPKESKEEESKNRRKLYRILGTVNLHALAIKFDSTGFPIVI
jgi:hypothetical protein